MNRRDLLKQAGALAIGLPAFRASGMAGSSAQSGNKDLIVTFNGPFCFWMNSTNVLVMAPPVGTDYACAAHQAWIATSANEMQLNSTLSPGETPPSYDLKMNVPSNPVSYSGTCIFSWGQDEYLGANPLFNLTLPIPNKIIGVRPTCPEIIYGSTPPQQQCVQGGADLSKGMASGLTFLYQNVDLSRVCLGKLDTPQKSSKSNCFFTPCFDNDKDLPAATLGVHLSKLDQHPDEKHKHASYVWSQMLSMYPWMLEDIKGIRFKAIAPGACTCVNAAAIGPGNDCEVPTMMLTLGGNLIRRKK